MELKKISIILIVILFSSHVKAELVKPNTKLDPYDVVKIQLEALKIMNLKIKVLNRPGCLLIRIIKKLQDLLIDLEL